MKEGFFDDLSFLEMLNDDSLEKRGRHCCVPDTVRIDDDDGPALADAKARRLSALHPGWPEQEPVSLEERSEKRVELAAASFGGAKASRADDDVPGVRLHSRERRGHFPHLKASCGIEREKIPRDGLAVGLAATDYPSGTPIPMTSNEKSSAPKPPSRISVRWAGGHRFDTGRAGGPVARLDGSSETGQSPADALLSALASCRAVDVVDILAKRRTPVTALEVDVVGERVDAVPRRYKHITLAFRISGDGVEREQAERAISLAVTKYCSVRGSLREDITVDWTLDLNAGPPGGKRAPK